MRLVAFLVALWFCGACPASAAVAWRWPLDGQPRVTRGFDPPDTPYGAGHRGVDLAGVPGEAVRAAGRGRIGFAGVLAGRGVVTVVHAGGLKTTYEPVRAVVRAGQPVVIGQLIGRLQSGHAGCPVSACLHWGLLRGSRYLDPLSLVGAGHVRLLPLGGTADVPPGSAAGPDRVAVSGAGSTVSPSPLTTQLGVVTLGVAALLAIRRRGP
jgi:murein DD-endopeptidase MepM/ murein hydrolase activator NlpD